MIRQHLRDAYAHVRDSDRQAGLRRDEFQFSARRMSGHGGYEVVDLLRSEGAPLHLGHETGQSVVFLAGPPRRARARTRSRECQRVLRQPAAPRHRGTLMRAPSASTSTSPPLVRRSDQAAPVSSWPMRSARRRGPAVHVDRCHVGAASPPAAGVVPLACPSRGDASPSSSVAMDRTWRLVPRHPAGPSVSTSR